MSDFIKFKAACGRWRKALGLMDWRVEYNSTRREKENGARCQTDSQCRHALITYNLARDTPHTLDELACHEMLHVVFADYSIICAKRGDSNHEDATREEHRIIERLLGVMT